MTTQNPSQFMQHVRAVSGLPLLKNFAGYQNFLMWNILNQQDLNDAADPHFDIVLYGKDVVPGGIRKIGHRTRLLK